MQDAIRHCALRLREPLMFWSGPGIGKSEGVAQVAAEEGAVLCDVRLSQYDSVDLRGFPGVHADTALTVWHAPSTLPFKGNPHFPSDRPIILFFDEANAAAQAVSAVAYQIVNDRRCGEHELMDNVVIVLAGNREGDRGVTNKQPLPLSNRLTHYEVVSGIDDWCAWASRGGQPAIGVAFLKLREVDNLLNTFDPSKPEKAFATPRTWVKALRYYADERMPLEIKQASMAGAIGDGPAAEFWGFVEVWQHMIPIEDILANPAGVATPDEMSMRYAVTVNVSGHMDAKTIKPLYTFLKRLDPEFTVLAWKLATKRDETLLYCNEFVEFSKQYGAIFR